MARTRRSPLDLLSDFNRRMERVLGEEGEEEDAASPRARWRPPTDVYRHRDAVVLEVEVPGVDRSDLDVNFENGRLTVSGERRPEKDAGGDERTYYRSERLYGTFHRSFALSDSVDHEAISASYDDGVLTVRVPTRSRSGGHRIEVS